ncbi:MAG: AcrR family transcriptional regulator [Bacteroidia bacterium]
MSDIQILRRRLSPERQRRREKTISQTMALMASMGTRFSMEDVASATHVSRSTLYRDFTSREHLIAEVTLAAGHALASHLGSHPPGGKTIGDRIGQLCSKVMQVAGENELLLACCVTNLSSTDPAVLDSYSEIEHVVSALMTSVLCEVKPANSGLVEPLVFRYLLGGFALATTGKIGYPQIAEELTQLCSLLLADVWTVECHPFDIPPHS